MSSALSIKNLKKTYDKGPEALKGVSLEVAAGDFYALLGPNGAGKSTLINIVCGLVNKSSGEVLIQGMSIDEDYQKAKMHVGIVPQEFNFAFFETVTNIVLDQAGFYGIPRRVAKPRAEALLKKLGIYDKRDTQAMKLSGGMKRRLMIARALLHQPELLILDEPTAGVDIELRRGMWDFLKELNESGVTIILTTHYLEEAEQLCRNISIINKGEIVAQGEIKKLLGEMDEETFVFDVGNDVPESVVKELSSYNPVETEHHLELTVSREHDLNSAFAILSAASIKVITMRNKTNRLEEFFVQKTQKK